MRSGQGCWLPLIPLGRQVALAVSSEVELRKLGWIFKWPLYHEPSFCPRKWDSREKGYLQIMPKSLISLRLP